MAKRQQIEYLYGSNVVIPALTAGRRRIAKLLVKDDKRTEHIARMFTEHRLDSHSNPVVPNSRNLNMLSDVELAMQMASEREIKVEIVSKEQLDKLSSNRPHQGLVLAAFPLKHTSINGLGECIGIDDTDSVEYELVNGLMQTFHRKPRRKHPVWLALDQVVDPQNLGSIYRSAYYFGVDGIVITDKESASFTPTASKASSGVMEAMPLYTTVNLAKFITNSSQNGWCIVGTDIKKDKALYLHEYTDESAIDVMPVAGQNVPALIVLGNEGRGMRQQISKLCDVHLAIGSAMTDSHCRVDSLNVSAAASILLHDVLMNKLQGP